METQYHNDVTTTQGTEQTPNVHLFSTSCTKPAVAAWYEGDVAVFRCHEANVAVVNASRCFGVW